jgi:hypothetical protein
MWQAVTLFADRLIASREISSEDCEAIFANCAPPQCFDDPPRYPLTQPLAVEARYM